MNHRLTRFALACVIAALPVAARADDVQPAPPPAPAPQQMTGGSALAPNATIGPGDKLAIGVYGDASLSQTVTVQSDGTIQYPLVGRVAVAGLTPPQAKNLITDAMRKFLKRPVVSVAIAESGQMAINVMGNVKNSGMFTVRSGSHVTDVIASAGGIRSLNGTYPLVRVAHPNGVLQEADLDKLFRKGDVTQNVALTDKDIVYVTGADTIVVKVLGAVTRPGNVEVNQGDRLSTALARAGVETTVHPDLNRITVTRTDPATKTATSYSLNLYQALNKGDMRYDPVLQKDDVVFIPEARQVSPGTIGLLGILGRVLGF